MNIIIIGITSPSRSCRYKLIKSLLNSINATILHWEDFVQFSPKSKKFNYLPLVKAIKNLKSKNTIKIPKTDHIIQPSHYIFLETPFGRLNKETNKYIDYCIYICTKKYAPQINFMKNTELKHKKDIALALKYQQNFNNKLKYSSDFIISETLCLKAQVQAIKHYLRYQIYLTSTPI